MKKTLSGNSRAVIFVTVLVLTALIVGIGCAGFGAYAADNRVKTTRVAHLSDVHMMPKEYANIHSKEFNSDAGMTKMLAETEATLATALGELYEMEDAPTVVLVSGDLTSNGEKRANEVVAQYFAAITEKMRTRPGYEKFQIFVMPGNHDMYNDGAVSYMPTKEELAACASDAERLELMENYVPRSVETTTSKDIYEIYSDFGYCNCPNRKNGEHIGDCKIAQGVKLSFFYESEFWYDDATKRTTQPDGTVKYEGFDARNATDAEVKAYEDNNLDFEYLAEAGRIGACSYVATIDGVTVIGVDGNAREYTGDRSTVATASAGGWDETTGGMVTRAQLRWIVEETKDEVAADNLMLANCHFNNIPHFTSQDEVISLFVLDNLEQYTSTLANAGIRYNFSGHQHAFDIVDTITQEGNVSYDIETGSLVSYGSGYRTLTFTQEWKNGNYSEDVKSTVHSLDKNAEDGFYYATYKLTSEIGGDETAVTPEDCLDYNSSSVSKCGAFTTDDVNLYAGTDYLTLVKRACVDAAGEKIGVGDYLTQGLAKLISMDGMIGGIVNDGLFDMLSNMVGGMSFVDGKPFTKALLNDLINGLADVDFPAFVDNGDGTFKITDKPVAGNSLVDYATDLVEWVLNYDFSYGTRQGGTTLAEILVIVYGGHLSGAHTDTIHSVVQPLIDKLYDGTFVDFLINTLLVDGIVPQLDFLFDVPIRWDAKTANLSSGAGIDITAALKTKATAGLDSTIKSLFQNYGLKTVDKNGYSSLKCVITDVEAIAKDLLVTPEEDINDSMLQFLAPMVRNLLQGFGDIGKYVDMVLDYINQYLDDGKLYNILQKELINKYVTDAFCRNLGYYAAYIVGGMSMDNTPDGSSWGAGDYMKEYTVKNQKDFNIATKKSNAASVYGGKAFYRAKGTKGSLAVTPTVENGMLASMITVSFDKDLTSTKKITWYTSIEQNVFDKNASGEYEFSVPASEIEYSLDKNLKDAKRVTAQSENVDRELPTIDLGIAYFNISHRYKLYNKHTVSLTDLEAGKTYYYRLGSDKYGWSETYSFTTAAEGDFRFMAITDVQGSVQGNYEDSLPSLKTAMEYFGDSGVSFIASLGDNVDNGKNIKQFTWWLDEQSEIWANNTFVTAGGNHEKKEYALSSVIALPDNATVNETGHYYSYDYNYAHFIVLDTNDIDGNELGKTQTEWLIDDLTKNKENKATKWTVVMLHKGPYTAGSHAFDADVIGLRKQLTPLFADNGVDLVLQGHDHTYSVSEYIGRDGQPVEVKTSSDGTVVKPEGVLYINLGTMGDKFYDYIYSDEVSIIKRASVDERLEKYVTADGYLELKETPVFADISVKKDTLTINTYTIIDGEVVPVDAINIAKSSTNKYSAIAAITAVSVAAAAIIALCIVGAVARKKKNAFLK